METFELITDNLRECKSNAGAMSARFRYGAEMHVIKTEQRDLSNYPDSASRLSFHRMICCSSVKTCLETWIYLIPGHVNLDLAYRWIDEISPIFPTLEIEILPISRIILRPCEYSTDLDTPLYTVRAIYSQKAYPVEAYLAHHLIRAFFDNDTIPYIYQYFKIKESTPDLYFWNRIFLCQFGLKMYYYYWLTDRRTFTFTNKKAFEKVAFAYPSTSTLDFFEYFKKDVPNYIKKLLQKQYINGNFDLFIKNMSLNLWVIPTDKYKRKCHNFDFSAKYKVDLETESEYIITADDYRQRKYKKTNFNIIEE